MRPNEIRLHLNSVSFSLQALIFDDEAIDLLLCKDRNRSKDTSISCGSSNCFAALESLRKKFCQLDSSTKAIVRNRLRDDINTSLVLERYYSAVFLNHSSCFVEF